MRKAERLQILIYYLCTSRAEYIQACTATVKGQSENDSNGFDV